MALLINFLTSDDGAMQSGDRSEPWLLGAIQDGSVSCEQNSESEQQFGRANQTIVDPGVKKALWWTAMPGEVIAVTLEGLDLSTRPQI